MSSLIPFLDSVLGTGTGSSSSNRKYLCPFVGCANRPSRIAGQKKLEVDMETIIEDGKPVNIYHCWSCGEKGKSIYNLLKKIGATEQRFNELKEILKYTDTSIHKPKEVKGVFSGQLPAEFKSVQGKLPKHDLKLRHAKAYVKKRNVREDDIIKWNIGYCEEGRYRNRIVIPSYDKSMKVNYLIGRALSDETFVKYEFPECSRDIIPFESMINWSKPIILCEGVFDMFTIKRNCIPLLGKVIQPELMKKLLTCKSKKVYLCLDSDALKESLANCQLLMEMGKTVYLVELDEKDPGSMTFEDFTKLIQQVSPLTTSKLMKMKINKI
jgi:DNA primase